VDAISSLLLLLLLLLLSPSSSLLLSIIIIIVIVVVVVVPGWRVFDKLMVLPNCCLWGPSAKKSIQYYHLTTP
jgi:hypothetical protein